MKYTWFIKQDVYHTKKSKDIDSWTITTNADYAGWKTDDGIHGYGLPKELAEWICNKLNQCEEPPYIRKKGKWEKNDGKQ